MADYTENLNIYKPGVHWLDENPGQGPAAMVSQALDNIDSALSSGGAFKTASVSISSAQLLAMMGTPVQILPAMPGCIVQPMAAMFQYIAVTTGYALGDATSLYIGSVVNPIDVTNVLQPIPGTILDGATVPGNVVGLFPASNVLVTAQSWFENQALVLTHNGSSELTLGDGTAVVTVCFMQVSV
jgi:hypothetical protein